MFSCHINYESLRRSLEHRMACFEIFRSVMERVADLFWCCPGLHGAFEKGASLRVEGCAMMEESRCVTARPPFQTVFRFVRPTTGTQTGILSTLTKHVQMYKSEDGVEPTIVAEASG